MTHFGLEATMNLMAGDLTPGLPGCGCRAGQEECAEAQFLHERMESARRAHRLGLCSRDILIERTQACLRHLSTAA
jgi:hypothetical protein